MKEPPQTQKTTGSIEGFQEDIGSTPKKVSNPYAKPKAAVSYSNIANEEEGQTQIQTNIIQTNANRLK